MKLKASLPTVQALLKSSLQAFFGGGGGGGRGDIWQRLDLRIDKIRGKNMSVVMIVEDNYGSYLQWIRGHITGHL